MADPASLSVCIVTYERRAFLRRCLAALAANLTDDVEIVVVDASASDASDIVREVRPSAVYVHDRSVAGWMTQGAQRGAPTRAAATSSASSTTTSSSPPGGRRLSWTRSRIRRSMPSRGAPATASPARRSTTCRSGACSPTDRSPRASRRFRRGVIEVDHGIGANMSFRRSVLARLGGFRDDYPGTAMREDTDIYLRVRRLGGRAVFSPDAVVDHLPAPHAKGRRFDTRYKLYARRNHMVLLARDAGIRSPQLRRWIAREYRAVLGGPRAAAQSADGSA